MAPAVEHFQAPLFSCYQIAPAGAQTDAGFAGLGAPTINSVPGVFAIDPPFVFDGTNEVFIPTWANFSSVAQLSESITGGWYVKNVVLRKQLPELGQCYDFYSENTPGFPGFNQQGSDKVRTYWPLMYEAPGTTWTLTLTSGTKNAVNGYYLHQDVWYWTLDADLTTILCELDLFHNLPFGLCEVPLISNQFVYAELVAQWNAVIAAFNAGALDIAAEELIEFECLVMDYCDSVCPAIFPADAQLAQIVQTVENPVCCKLIVDAEYLANKYGIFMAVK